ncbi:MAG: NTP transferase domain-containing protein [Chloroflexota bacterium]|nr:NTP transferase domain-containing protein [Chloroflexota bacterium]
MSNTPHLIILAGGASSRMWPLREKSLIRFGAEPLLISQLRRFQALGYTDAIIVGNPENHADIAALLVSVPTMNTQVVVQPEARGMGDALLRAADALPPDAPIAITQVHDVVDDALHLDLLAAFRADSAAAYVAGNERDDYFPGGYLIVGADGRLTGIIEKPGAANRPSKLVNIVAHIYPRAGTLFDAIRAEYARDLPSDDHYERAMDALMKTSLFKVVPYRGAWSALKFPWHVLDIMNHFLAQIKGQHIADSAKIAPTASVSGDVFIGEGARVFGGAAVVGPAYIGAGTIVGNNALVRNSMVLDRCNVGFTTEVARSYVADHVDMHACRVLDSVFASGVNFSAGCTTANLRIDRGNVPCYVKGQKIDTGRDKLGAIIGQGAFLAVDVMTMPGVKVGEDAQVGPGMHVHKDISDGARAYVKQEIVVIERDGRHKV